MIDAVGAIIAVLGFSTLAVWSLHAGGFRVSPTLQRFEGRFPAVALLSGVISPRKRNELLGGSRYPLAGIVARLLVRGGALILTLSFFGAALYFLWELIQTAM